MDGTTSTGGGAVGPIPGRLACRDAGDFNGDGKSDILWQNDNGTPAIWLMDGTNFDRRGRGLAQSGAELACQGCRRLQRRRQVRHPLAERQRDAGDLAHGWHEHEQAASPCPILGRAGTSKKRPISTATASPTSCGRTTTARRRSGRWTAPTSQTPPSFPIRGTTGT